MRTEYEVMEALKGYIENHIEEYYDAMPSASGCLGNIAVTIDSPDPDNMPGQDTFWLEFDNGTAEEDSLMTDVTAMAVNVHVMCSRDSQNILQLKCWGYFSAFYQMLRNNDHLGGAVDMSMVTDWEWYPYVSAKPGCAVIKSTVTLQWQKDFRH